MKDDTATRPQSLNFRYLIENAILLHLEGYLLVNITRYGDAMLALLHC